MPKAMAIAESGTQGVSCRGECAECYSCCWARRAPQCCLCARRALHCPSCPGRVRVVSMLCHVAVVRAQSVALPTVCVEYRVVLGSVRRVLLLWSGAQTAAVRCARVECCTVPVA